MVLISITTGWDADNKGPNIWDTYTHRSQSPIFDGSTGDVACDSYHNYKEDVQLLKNMGVNLINAINMNTIKTIMYFYPRHFYI